MTEMGGILSNCKCTSAAEQDLPLEPLHPSNVDLYLVDSEENNAARVSESMIDDDDEPESPQASYQLSLLETLNSFRHDGLFTDFIIKVNGKDFPAHKNVLAAGSAFFRELFTKDDASQNSCPEFEKVDPRTMENILNFLYTGKCKLDQLNDTLVGNVAEVLGLIDLLNYHIEHADGKEGSACKLKTTFNSHNQETLLSKLLAFQVDGLYCDLTLTTCSGRVIPVHKNVLAAVSCYFKGLFRSEMKEVHESNVDFGVIDEGIVEELLNFIYSGEISITFDNAKSLLQASDYLLVEHLKRRVIDFVKSS